jgi:Cu-processing system ATP-binding protein
MIHTHGLVKRFGKRTVLDGLDATIAAGRITALVGPNGAGKTTFLKVLLGLARADAGQVRIGDLLLDGTPGYRAKIGYMPQIAHFPAHLRGRDLLAMVTALRGGTESADLSLAEAFALDEPLDRPLGQLSGGTRQKINAVLAFAFRPALLILDEPTAGLDPLAARILKDRILEERARGTTVLITSHVLPELEELADDVLFLVEGKAAWSGEVKALTHGTGERTFERAIARLLSGGAPRLAVA